MGASIVLLALSLALQLLVANSAVAASLSVSPTSGAPGTSAQVVGGGFPASQSVSLCWDATSCSNLGTVQSGVGSSFSVAITIPSDATVGRHQIYACRSQNCASTVFDVLSVTTTTSSPTTTTSTASTTSTTLATTTTSTVAGAATTTVAGGPTTTVPGAPTTTVPGAVPTSTVAGSATVTVPGGATTTVPGAATTSTVLGAQVFATTTTTPLTDTATEGGLLARDFAVVGDTDPDPSPLRWFAADPPMSIDAEVPSMVPGVAGPGPFDAVEVPTWLQPFAPITRLPLWGQALVLSAGVAVLFFLVPLAARWLWQLREDE